MSGVKVNNGVTNYGGMPSGGGGLLANRPAAGVLGRIYIATDTLELYRDTGLVWTTIGGPGSGTVTGTGTVNEITFWNGAGSIGSLTTAVYPSLTELSYVKGVTSGIQTQINGKQDAIILTTIGTGGAATFIGNTLNVPQYQAALTNPVTGTGVSGQAAFWNGTNSIIGDNAFHWDNVNKRLGINTVNPGVRLDIHGTGIIQQLNGTTTNDAYLDFQNAGVTQWRIGNFYNGALNQFGLFNSAGGTNLLTILQGGNVGISYTAPTAKLAVSGFVLINTNFNNTVDALQVAGSGTFANGLTIATTSGSVGIGGTPTVKLSVISDNTDADAGQIRVEGLTNGAKKINVGIHTTNNYGFIQAINAGTGYYPLALNPNGGNVGVGYDSPNVKLSVAGSVYQGTNTANALYEVFCNGNLYTGGLSPTILTVSGNTTMARTATGYRCTTTLTLTLPAASGLNNIYYVIANTGATITVQRSGTDTILDKTGTSVTSVTILPGTRSMFYVGGGTETFQIF